MRMASVYPQIACATVVWPRMELAMISNDLLARSAITAFQEAGVTPRRVATDPGAWRGVRPQA
ncbi:MAG: hypothetical protein NVS3B18_16380 [Candidatus Dormibacteria bacterium]